MDFCPFSDILIGHVPVLSRRHAGVPLEYGGEILGAGKAQSGCNLRNALLRSGQPPHGVVHLGNIDVVVDCDIDSILKDSGQMPGGYLAGFRHIGQGEPLLHVVADILDGPDGQGVFDDEDAPVALGELPGQQKNHLINISLTYSESIFQTYSGIR